MNFSKTTSYALRRGGGFVLNKDVEDIYIAEIIEAVEDLDVFNIGKLLNHTFC